MSAFEHTFAVEHQLAGAQAMDLADSLRGYSFNGVSQLTLDVTWVTEIDASGIAMLVRLYSQLQERGIGLQVANASADLARELDRVALSSVVTVIPRPRPRSHTSPMRPIPAPN